MHRRVRRWSGGLAAALFLVSVSLLTAEPRLLAASAPAHYVASARSRGAGGSRFASDAVRF